MILMLLYFKVFREFWKETGFHIQGLLQEFLEIDISYDE